MRAFSRRAWLSRPRPPPPHWRTRPTGRAPPPTSRSSTPSAALATPNRRSLSRRTPPARRGSTCSPPRAPSPDHREATTQRARPHRDEELRVRDALAGSRRQRRPGSRVRSKMRRVSSPDPRIAPAVLAVDRALDWYIREVPLAEQPPVSRTQAEHLREVLAGSQPR